MNPFLTNASATEAPMPDDAPVTTANFPMNLSMGRSIFGESKIRKPKKSFACSS